MSMTKREMIEAMLAGKTLVMASGHEAFFDESKTPPFRFRWSGEENALVGAWDSDWRIKTEPKKRPMTQDEILHFCATNPGIVVKLGEKGHPMLSKAFGFDTGGPYFWSKSSPTGDYEWHPFETEVTDE